MEENTVDHVNVMKTFGAFFAIMNPLVNLPIFLAMTNGMTVAEQRKLAIKIVIFSAAMSAAIVLGGKAILGFFGISIADFRVAGGMVLTTIAWSMLNGSQHESHSGNATEQKSMKDLASLAFYPMTFPMIVGPGTIATIIIFTSHAKTMTDMMAIGGVLGAILAMLFVVLFFASTIGQHLSQTLRSIVTRLMGMILLAIAVDMVIGGLKVALPGLAS